MRSAPPRPILITGAHRSGTTWVGHMLAAAPGLGYLHEPFNPEIRPGISSAPFAHWFTYITEENAAPFEEGIRDTLSFRYHARDELRTVHTPRDAARLMRDWGRFAGARLRGAVPLVKDPIALFSAEWLARRFEMQVLVMIRHPAAFASSLRRLGFAHPFSHFLEQPLLMRDLLHPFEAEIARFAAQEQEIVDQAILLWRILYSVVAQYQARHPEWLFLRHEELSRDALVQYRRLFERLGLSFTPQVQRTIEAHSHAGNPAESPQGKSLKLDSRAAARSWRKRLSEAEIDRIRSGVEDVASGFYSDVDW